MKYIVGSKIKFLPKQTQPKTISVRAMQTGKTLLQNSTKINNMQVRGLSYGHEYEIIRIHKDENSMLNYSFKDLTDQKNIMLTFESISQADNFIANLCGNQ